MDIVVENPVERILMFIVGVVFIIGSIKFLMLAFGGVRVPWQAFVFGVLAFMLGSCLCVWGVVGPPG